MEAVLLTQSNCILNLSGRGSERLREGVEKHRVRAGTDPDKGFDLGISRQRWPSEVSKSNTYKRILVRVTGHFSPETLHF